MTEKDKETASDTVEWYDPSRDENGDWLPIFGGIQTNAAILFNDMVKMYPALHPYDISTAIKSRVDYEAVCAHGRNKRRKRL